MKKLFIAWQDPIQRRWMPVGKLDFVEGVYRFLYTKGAKNAKDFMPFGLMKDLSKVYKSTELFPLFSNRLLNKSRPEYKDFLHWLKLREDEDDPLALLALTEGKRETDNLEIFPCPEKTTDEKYLAKFFVHGIQHLGKCATEVISNLKNGERLLLMADLQNPYDQYAIAIRNIETIILGYSPRYLAIDFNELLKNGDPKDIFLEVEQVNLNAPLQLRLLCQITSPWPSEFRPCSSENYLPINTASQME